MRCTMKMYFSFFFFFLFLSTVFFLLFTFNTVNFDHTLSHRVNLLSIFFFSNFSCLLYTSLYWSTVKASLNFLWERCFLFFFVSYIRFLCCTLWKNMHSFLFSSIFSYDDFTSFFNMHTVHDWRTFGVYYICVFVQETEMSLTNYLNFCGHRK